jgi:hypothetical protein
MANRSFEGTWRVIASSSPPQYYMKIEKVAGFGEHYELSHGESEEGPWTLQQTLEYKSDTGTLERIGNVGQERCIVFWDRKNRNGAPTNSIFAMRIQTPDESSTDRFPWEMAGDHGTWGAEGG